MSRAKTAVRVVDYQQEAPPVPESHCSGLGLASFLATFCSPKEAGTGVRPAETVLGPGLRNLVGNGLELITEPGEGEKEAW